MNPKKIMISEKESRFMDDIRMSIERPFVGDYNLHIREVRYDDRGEYTCAVNTEPVQTKRIRLIVQGNIQYECIIMCFSYMFIGGVMKVIRI